MAGVDNRKQVRLASSQDGRVRQMPLFQELKRRNVIRVAMAYAVVAWLLVEIASVVFESFEAPVRAIKLFISFVLLGFPLALFLAWAFEMTLRG